MKKLLEAALNKHASDVFITAGKTVSLRISGELYQSEGTPISADEIDRFRLECIGNDGEEVYRQKGGYDASVVLDDGTRFRLNFFTTIGGPALVGRAITAGCDLRFEELGLPAETLKKIASQNNGIIIIAGSTGSGKSTTMGALINYINQNFARHILTLEDPIEFLHRDQNSLISQREINSRICGFAEAMRYAMRENPDVIVIGEIRDAETVSAALAAAQSGHLVISTMHTIDAVNTCERIAGFFPLSERENVVQEFARTVDAVIVQKLLPKADGAGMAPVLEIMIGTGTVRKAIANSDAGSLEEAIRFGAQSRMNNFNQALFQLYEKGIVTAENVLSASDNPGELQMMFEGMRSGGETLKTDKKSGLPTSITVHSLLRAAVRNGASDLLITAGAQPMLRINGALRALEVPKLTANETSRLLFSIIGRRRRTILEETKELDFSLTAQIPGAHGAPPENHRFRVNAFYQRGALAMVARVISDHIPEPAALGIPPHVQMLMRKKQGLILITGPTGSGKSTTLASLIQQINEMLPLHILTLEDPIEYVYENRCAVIEQRELGFDTKSFAGGLRAALREAPDIIMVGELRDPETISAALTAAETGHLVLGTLHTNSVSQTIDRIIGSFSEYMQNQIRQQFAASLLAVVSQRLLKRIDRDGRVAAFEVMVATPPIKALLRENKNHMIQSSMETGAKDGMVTLERALEELANAKIISQEDRLLFSVATE